MLILGGCAEMPKKPAGASSWLYQPAMLVAPYYGIDADGSRGGIARELVDAVRWLRWPQFLWDMLPLHGPAESILRLDNAFALGRHHDRVDLTEHCLSDRALTIVHDQLFWLTTGLLPAEGDLFEARDLFEKDFVRR